MPYTSIETLEGIIRIYVNPDDFKNNYEHKPSVQAKITEILEEKWDCYGTSSGLSDDKKTTVLELKPCSYAEGERK